MTATATRTRTAKKSRSLRLLCWLPDVKAGIVRITEGSKVDLYHVKRLASDYGTAFEVTKHVLPAGQPGREETPYHVCLDGKSGTCECMGYVRWHHCRHVEGLSALVAAGKLS